MGLQTRKARDTLGLQTRKAMATLYGSVPGVCRSSVGLGDVGLLGVVGTRVCLDEVELLGVDGTSVGFEAAPKWMLSCGTAPTWARRHQCGSCRRERPGQR